MRIPLNNKDTLIYRDRSGNIYRENQYLYLPRLISSSQRVEMMALRLLKAILKFCANNKLWKSYSSDTARNRYY